MYCLFEPIHNIKGPTGKRGQVTFTKLFRKAVLWLKYQPKIKLNTNCEIVLCKCFKVRLDTHYFNSNNFKYKFLEVNRRFQLFSMKHVSVD